MICEQANENKGLGQGKDFAKDFWLWAGFEGAAPYIKRTHY
jgi:hypothetical protein